MSWQLQLLLGVILVLIMYDELYLKSVSKNRKFKEHKLVDAKRGSLKKFKEKDSTDNIYLSKNVSVSMNHNRLTSNNMVYVIASSGRGKTTSLILNNLLFMGMDSFKIITDVGRSILPTWENWQGVSSKADEYTNYELDLFNFNAAQTFNPLYFIKTTGDNSRLLKNGIATKDEIVDDDFIKTILSCIVNSSAGDENDFWTTNTKQIAECIILLLCYKEFEEYPRNLVSVCSMFALLFEPSDSPELFPTKLHELFGRFENDLCELPENKSAFSKLVQQKQRAAYIVIEKWNMIKSQLGSDKKGDSNYLQSVFGSFSTNFDKILSPNASRILKDNSIPLEDIGKRGKKYALFITLRENGQNYNFITGMMYATLFDLIVFNAAKNDSNKLDENVSFYLDEFGSTCFIPNVASTMETIRKKANSLLMFIICQNIKQTEKRYGKEDAQRIFDDCSIKLYMGSDSLEDRKMISQLSGETLITTNGESHSAKSNSHSTNESIRPLVSLNDTILENYKCLIFTGNKKYTVIKDDMVFYKNMKEYKKEKK